MRHSEPGAGDLAEGCPGGDEAGGAEELASRWLLSSGVQLSGPPETGGVGGWMDPSGEVPFAYGEVTGYFLSYLRFLECVASPATELRDRAQAACRWLLRRWVDAPIPLTRCYLSGRHSDDWRNSFLFSFDTAMILRGVWSAAGYVDPALAEAVICGLAPHLRESLDPDGTLQCARQVRDGPRLERWSLRPGPYQLKAAAALLTMNCGLLPHWLLGAARNTWDQWSCFRLDSDLPGDQLHPALYFIEGLLIRYGATGDPENLQRAASAARAILGSLALERCPRSDCIAQALRVGAILLALGGLEPSFETQLANFSRRLASFQTPAGAVRFGPNGDGSSEHANAWCTMFSAQAWWAWRHRREPGAAEILLRALV